MARVILTVAGLAGLAGLAGPVAAQTYNSSADYSVTVNPNGVWTYGSTPATAANGYVPSGGTSLTVYDANSVVQPGLQAWTTSGSVGVPSAGINTSGADISRADSIFHPGRMFLHAGPSLASVVRFTAPAAGNYSLNVSFENRTTNRGWPVYVYRNATLLDSATFADYLQGGSHGYANPALTLAAGDTVDFAAGPRFDGDFNSTVTQVDAALTYAPVPEPAWTLAAGGLALSGLWLRRRIRQ